MWIRNKKMTEIRDCAECGCIFFVVNDKQTLCHRCSGGGSEEYAKNI